MGLQIATIVFVEDDAFLFEHALLLVVRQDQATGRSGALRVEKAVPRRAVWRRGHTNPDRPLCVAIAEQFGNLPVSHHSSRRNASHDSVNAFAILWVSLFRH